MATIKEIRDAGEALRAINRKKRKAQAWRKAYCHCEVHTGRDTSLPAPTIVQAIPGDVDGLVKVEHLDDPLTIRCPSGPAPGGGDQMYLEWSVKSASPEWIRVGPIDTVGVPPYMGTLPVEFFEGREGSFEVRYGFYDSNNDEQYYSDVTRLMIDRTPPWGDQNPPAPGYALDVIDQDYLDKNPTFELTIDRGYGESKINEVLLLLVWGSREDLPEEGEDFPPYAIEVGYVPQNGKVQIPKQVILDGGSGDKFAVYILVDKAGNISRLSAFKSVKVVLGRLPDELSPPEVPLATEADGFLIDRADAEEGVVIRFDNHIHFLGTDVFRIYWGSKDFITGPLSTYPQYPKVEINIEWSVIRDAYRGESGHTGNKLTPVKYELLRGLTITSDETEVWSNQERLIPGEPEDPDPNPVVGSLPLPIVFGSDAGDENHLPPDDEGKDATAVVTVFEDARPGTEFTLFYDGVQVGEPQTLPEADIPETLEFTIPWSLIEAHGNNPELIVHYRVDHEDFHNYALSRNQLVRVRVNPIVAPRVIFPHVTHSDGRINCNALRWELVEEDYKYGVWAEMPESEYLTPGRVVTLHWEIYDELDSPTAIVTEDWTITVPEEHTGDLRQFLSPYSELILPIHEPSPHDHGGWAACWYSILQCCGGQAMNLPIHEIDNEGWAACWYSIDLGGGDQAVSSKERTRVNIYHGGAGTCPVIPPDK